MELFSIFWLKKGLIWDVFNKYPFLDLILGGPYSVPELDSRALGHPVALGTRVPFHLVSVYSFRGRLLALFELLQ